MFKKILALVLATMMVLGGMVTVSAAEETAAAEEVVYDYTAAAEDLAALGILKGDGIDFALENGVTRWQMALFIARIMTGETNDQYWNKVSDNTTPYSDVVNYFGAISFADENGIIKGKGWIPGVGDNCFDPNGAITYQDAITMAVRALGSKQLAYPNGFLAVGEELGLMEGLEPLAQDAALTRGQMIQILKNMLYVKANGAASFAEQNFGLEETIYVVVATELQFLVGADRVYKVDYLDASNKYVALAPLNADGTYDLDKIIHLTETELGLAKGESETKLGYSYTVRSYTEFADAYEVVANDTKTVKNYGDAGKAIVAGTKYNNVNDNLVKIDGITYKLVEEYTNLNNKATNYNKQPELIVHSMFKGDADTTAAYYLYDTAFNILNPEDGKIALMYNHWTNTYYVEVFAADNTTSLGFREATNDDFAKYAYGTNVATEQYGITTTAFDLTNLSFSEITMIDDNGDGVWDRAIYIPYSVAKYSTYGDSNYRFTVKNSAKDSSKSKDAAPTLNGSHVKIYATVNNDKGSYDWQLVGGNNTYGYVRQSDIIFAGEGRPEKNDFIVYYFNPYSRTLTVVENLGKPVAGTVTNMTQGTYKWYAEKDATGATVAGNYIYDGATVTIDGEIYKLGYRWNESNKQFGKDFESIDPELAKYGYDEKIYGALVGNTYKKLSYLVLEGRVIYVADAGNECGWMAFDYGTYTNKNATLGYTAYDYTGDIIGVDADGNILVKAYVDKTGEQQIVKIGSINGFSYGLLVEDYAALNFQFSGIGALGTNAMDTMKKAVIADFFKTLTADVDDTVNTKDVVERQYLFIVTGVSETGVYEIYTDHELYWGNNGLAYRQPAKVNWTDNISFVNGISTTMPMTNSGSKAVVVTDAESKLLVVGKDGMKTVTGALNGTIDLHDGAVWAYSISNDFIFVADNNYNCNEIWYGAFDTAATNTGYTYYMVIGKVADNGYAGNTTVSAAYDVTTGKVVYTYKNLYNINTGALETKSVVGGLEEYNSAYAIYDQYNFNTPKPIGAIYAEKNDEWTMLTDKTKLVANTGLATSKIATDAAEVLEALLISGYTAGNQFYAPVYEQADLNGAATISANIINLKDYNDGAPVYDPYVSFTFDVVTITDTAVAVDLNKNSTGSYAGSIYFDYVEGKSFVGTVIKGDTSYTEPVVVPNDLAAAKTAALEELAAAAGNYAEDELAAAQYAILLAVNVEEVAVLKAQHLAIIIAAAEADKDAEADGIADALAQAKTDAKAVADTVAAGYTDDADVAAALASTKSIIDAQTDKAVVDSIAAGLVDETKVNDYALTRAIAAAKAKAEQEAAAESKITKVTANVVTLQNIAGIATDGISIWTDNNNGFGDIYAQQAGAFTKNADGSYTATFNYLTGTATATWVNNGTNVTLTFVKKSASGVALDMFTAGTTYRFVINASTGAGAYNVTAE